jgi:hypothetical protein
MLWGAALWVACGCSEEAGSGPGPGAGGASSGSGSGSGIAVGGGSAQSSSGVGAGGGGNDVVARLDQLTIKSAHNAYERDEAIFDQLVYHRLRSLELDVHVGKDGWPTVPGDWYVYHGGFMGDATSCHRLSDCMDELRGFRAAVPEHEALVLIVDLKNDFAAGHGPGELDARLSAGLAQGSFFTPADLLAGCPGATQPRQAVAPPCGWPRVDELRGRIVLVLTGAEACSGSNRLFSYVDSGAQRLGFAAGELDGSCTFTAADERLAFFNSNDPQQISPAAAAGLMSRVWDVNDQGLWNTSIAAGAQLLGTDKINFHEDPWAVTHSANGYPFGCSDCDARVEASDAIGVQVGSGDIWDSADSMLFVSASRPGSGLLSGSVSTVNSHTEPWGKACLMARASNDAAAPYFAVCRPSDQNAIRAQWRDSLGGSSSATDVALLPADTVDSPSAAWMRLELTPQAGNTLAAAYGSVDAENWFLIEQRTIAGLLEQRGIAASSHDAPPMRFVFHGLRYQSGTSREAWSTPAAVGGASAIGGADPAEVFAGVFP